MNKAIAKTNNVTSTLNFIVLTSPRFLKPISYQLLTKGYFSFLEDTINEPHMSNEQHMETLLEFLTQPLKKPCKVVVLPDFFLDRLVDLQWTPVEFAAKMADVAERKGGSLDGVSQVDMAGGNAVNVASASKQSRSGGYADCLHKPLRS